MRDSGPAVTGSPDALPVEAAVQLAAAAVLLQEGIEGGEQLGHQLLLDHLIRPLEQRRRDRQAERSCRRAVDR